MFDRNFYNVCRRGTNRKSGTGLALLERTADLRNALI